MIVITTVSSALMILYFKLRNNLKDFTFSYTTETINKNKSIVTLDHKKNFKIEKYNYINGNDPDHSSLMEGILTKDEYKKVRGMLIRCNFFKMRDSYDTEQSNNDASNHNIQYHIYFMTKEKEKRITIQNKDHKKLPSSFIKLLEHIDSTYHNRK